MAVFSPQDRVFVQCQGDPMWHARIPAAHVEGNEYVIVTPDYVPYVEELSLNNPDFNGFRVQPAYGGLPTGMENELIYNFGQMGEDDLLTLSAEAARIARAERLSGGLRGGPAPSDGAELIRPRPPAPPPPGHGPVGAETAGAAASALPVVDADASGAEAVSEPGPPPEIAPFGGLWVIDEPSGERYVGEVVALPRGSALLGDML